MGLFGKNKRQKYIEKLEEQIKREKRLLLFLLLVKLMPKPNRGEKWRIFL